MAKKHTEGPASSERAFHLSLYYKIVTIYIIVVALLYGGVRMAYEKGYVLMNTQIQYWLWYALIIGVILLIGKFIANMPKSPTTQRAVRICVGIVSIVTIFLMYVVCVNRIENDFSKYATMTSEDGTHKVLIMRADVSASETETEAKRVYTLYKAYPILNRFFCDGAATTDAIMLLNDPDATLNYEWTADSLTLTTDGETLEEMNTITVPLK